MLHYLIPTALEKDCTDQRYPANLVQFLLPLVQQAKRTGEVEAPLSQGGRGRHRYSMKATVEPGCAVFDISQGKYVLSFSALVWEEAQQERCWRQIESIYLKLARDYKDVRSLPPPRMPVTLPWLATLELNVPNGQYLCGLREFEECFAALLQISPLAQTAARKI